MSTVVLTGSGIEFFRMSALYSAAKLELLGMCHSRGSAIKSIQRDFGIAGKREEVVRKFGLLLELHRIYRTDDHVNSFPGAEDLSRSFAAKALQKNIPREPVVAAVGEFWSKSPELAEMTVSDAEKLPGIK